MIKGQMRAAKETSKGHSQPGEHRGRKNQSTERKRVTEGRERRIRIHEILRRNTTTDKKLGGNLFSARHIQSTVLQLTQIDGNASIHDFIALSALSSLFFSVGWVL